MTYRPAWNLWVATFACGLLLLIGASGAQAQERVLLEQTFTVPASGMASNIFVPTRATVSLDISVEPGKQLLLVVLTEEQWQAVSSGERAQGNPLLRTLVSGEETESVVLDRGTYAVALIAQGQASTRATLRARARAE